jgi:hypothetical protein
MLWFLRRVLDRLFAKLTLHLASELETHMEMELTERRAELLRRANELQKEEVPGIAEVAGSLRARAEKLGAESCVPAGDAIEVIERLRAEDLREANRLALAQAKKAEKPGVPALTFDAPASSKKRGRPRKDGGASPDTGSTANSESGK